MFDYALADFLWAQTVLLLGPTVAALGLSIQIPIATVIDLLIGDPAWLKTAGSIALTASGTLLILLGFFGVNARAGAEEQRARSRPGSPVASPVASPQRGSLSYEPHERESLVQRSQHGGQGAGTGAGSDKGKGAAAGAFKGLSGNGERHDTSSRALHHSINGGRKYADDPTLPVSVMPTFDMKLTTRLVYTAVDAAVVAAGPVSNSSIVSSVDSAASSGSSALQVCSPDPHHRHSHSLDAPRSGSPSQSLGASARRLADKVMDSGFGQGMSKALQTLKAKQPVWAGYMKIGRKDASSSN